MRLSRAALAWICCIIENVLLAEAFFGGQFLRRFRGEDLSEGPIATTTHQPPIRAEQVIQQRMGSAVRTKKYNNMMYTGYNGGPVKDGDDLECNFEGYCCWDNVKMPTDQFDWMWATGATDPDKTQPNFGVGTKPRGRYLLAARPKSSATDEAMFVGCTITCTTRPIKVHLKHWTTPGVQLQVCSSETFFNENSRVELINCKDVKRSESPGPSVITIPPGEFIDLVIVASNFQKVDGGVAIIDDITVDVTPCSDYSSGKKKPIKP